MTDTAPTAPRFTLMLVDGVDPRPLYYGTALSCGQEVWEFDLTLARWFGSVEETITQAKVVHGKRASKFKKKDKVYVIDDQRKVIKTFKHT
jgi:hypothetical protein